MMGPIKTYARLWLYLLLIYFQSLVQCCEKSISGISLKGHTYRSVVTRNILDCFYTCAEEEQCQSLNYYYLSRNCQLNKRTIKYRPNYVTADEESLYFSNPFSATIGSSKNVPAISCLEMYNADEKAVSGRYWLLDKSGKPRKAYCNMKKGVLEECSTHPKSCLNGATCEYHGRGTYKCICLPGFTGEHCENNIDECSSNPCQNGGVCKDNVDGYVCECPDLYTEKNCQLAKGAECKNYTNLTDFNRNIRYPNLSWKRFCDENLQPGWYRFTGDAGSRMLDYGVMPMKCSANSPGWMDGTNPTVSEGIVERKACFGWAKNPCDFFHMIHARNCSLFYVYNLVKTDYCGRYCGRD